VAVNVGDVVFDDLLAVAPVAAQRFARVGVEFHGRGMRKAGLFEAERLAAGAGADLDHRQLTHASSTAAS
jgi:hypothetical protein